MATLKFRDENGKWQRASSLKHKDATGVFQKSGVLKYKDASGVWRRVYLCGKASADAQKQN